MDRTTIALAAVIVALPACGPTAGGSDGSGEGGTSGADGADGASQEGGSSGEFADCFFEGETFPAGAEFDSEDGCFSYVCEATQATVTDDRTTAWPGDLVLSSQSDLDDNACLVSVSGTLTINGSVENTRALRRLTTVGDRLEIIDSDVESLTLAHIGEVGDAIIIADNRALTSMAFSPYMSVFGDVEIRNNDALASLDGAEFIGQCGACSAHVDDTPGTLAGGARPVHDDVADTGPDEGGPFPGDGSEPNPGNDGGLDAGDGSDEPGGGIFYGNILIAENYRLTDVSAMRNLVFAWSDLIFRNNGTLAELELSVSEVQGDLEISGHPALRQETAMTLVSNADVWGEIRVCGNLDGEACPQ